MQGREFFKNPVTSYKEAFSLSTMSHQIPLMHNLDKKSEDISRNIIQYKQVYSDLSGTFPLYHDPSGNVEFTQTKTLKEAVKKDINEMIYQQNNTYIIGMFTITTILILTFLVLQKK